MAILAGTGCLRGGVKDLKRRWRRFSVLGMFAVLALAFAILLLRCLVRIREREREQAESEALIRAHTDNAPPADFRGWLSEFGANEPNPATSEGREALESERARLPASKERLRRLIEQLPSIFASEDESPDNVFLLEFDSVLEDFSRASCAELLRSVRWDAWSGDIKSILNSSDSSRGALVIERYYRVFCHMGDKLWTRGGLEYEAAEADAWIFDTLRRSRDLAERSRWKEVESAIDRCLEHWKEFRCDSEASNFCRSHRFWEDRYNRYYRDRVRRGETDWLRPLSMYYRYHLELARGILKREPKWSPGAGHGLYDDVPELK